MKSKLGLKINLTLVILILSIPVFAKWSTKHHNSFVFNDTFLLKFNPVLQIGNGCSGYLFPGTNVVWTLNKCLCIEREKRELMNIITSSKLNYQSLEFHNDEATEVRDTFKRPKILFQYNDWALLKVDLPLSTSDSSHIYMHKISSLTDTFMIGYPEITEYTSDAVKNYVDWILMPLWQYQLDTFQNRYKHQKDISTSDIKNESVTYMQELIENNKDYLIDFRKSEIPYLKAYTTNKAIEFCIKRWTDHKLIRNRMATLSNFEDSPSKRDKLDGWLRSENKQKEMEGLASSLFITFSLLPIELLPTKAIEIVLSFQKDFGQAATFLLAHPNVLNEINLAVRNIKFLTFKSPKDMPKWNHHDTILNGNGNFKIIRKLISNNLTEKGYWKVPGLEGAPIFSNGFLLGIHNKIPFYYSREFACEKKINYISIKELHVLEDNDNFIEIWKKISGLIEK